MQLTNLNLTHYTLVVSSVRLLVKIWRLFDCCYQFTMSFITTGPGLDCTGLVAVVALDCLDLLNWKVFRIPPPLLATLERVWTVGVGEDRFSRLASEVGLWTAMAPSRESVDALETLAVLIIGVFGLCCRFGSESAAVSLDTARSCSRIAIETHFSTFRCVTREISHDRNVCICPARHL
jgi:hypothetical protein